MLENSQERLIKSVLIVRYIEQYSHFEKKIVSIFRNVIKNLDHKYKSKLYFVYGGLVGSDIFYDYESESLKLNGNPKYSDEELFKKLNLNKIIKFDNKEKIIHQFNFSIDSIQSKISYDFRTCCLKLMSMRNCLAHELSSINFTEKEIIETLSKGNVDKMLKESSVSLDNSDNSIMVDISVINSSNMDNVAISLYGNLYYMQAIMAELDTIEV